MEPCYYIWDKETNESYGVRVCLNKGIEAERIGRPIEKLCFVQMTLSPEGMWVSAQQEEGK